MRFVGARRAGTARLDTFDAATDAGALTILVKVPPLDARTVVVRPQYKPVAPDQRLRELRKDFKAFNKQEPGPERAADLAVFARAAHEERQLNMTMHAAQLCLDEDPDAPALLLGAYLDEDDDPEEYLRATQDLADIARYIGRADVAEAATEHVDRIAESWVAAGDDVEQRHRLRTIASILGRAYSDTLRLKLK